MASREVRKVAHVEGTSLGVGMAMDTKICTSEPLAAGGNIKVGQRKRAADNTRWQQDKAVSFFDRGFVKRFVAQISLD